MGLELISSIKKIKKIKIKQKDAEIPKTCAKCKRKTSEYRELSALDPIIYLCNDCYEELDEIRKNKLFEKLKLEIKNFAPLFNSYSTEVCYHIDLARYLKNKHPTLKVEYQERSSRPDIVIGDVAIEIKGPTRREGLETLVSKCLRYVQHFPRGLIIVLFDIQVSDSYLTDLEMGIWDAFPNVYIIKK